MGLDINTIRDNYNTGKYSVGYNYPGEAKEADLKKLPQDYIFDENLSVKRNREMVIEHNDRVETLRARKKSLQADLDRRLTEDVVDYITENYNLSRAQARIVEMLVYQEKHAFMCEYFSYVDTFAEFAETVIEVKE